MKNFKPKTKKERFVSVRLHCGDWFGKGREIRLLQRSQRLETRIKGLGGREVWLQMDLGIQVGGG